MIVISVWNKSVTITEGCAEFDIDIRSPNAKQELADVLRTAADELDPSFAATLEQNIFDRAIKCGQIAKDAHKQYYAGWIGKEHAIRIEQSTPPQGQDQ